MIVIGADTHKRTHALAAVDAGTGQVRGGQEIAAAGAGELAALRWARGLDDDRVWAIEDCRHVSGRFEQALLAAGERVVRVAPHRMGASRRGERDPGKSDQIDALAVARAVVKDGLERFPAAHVDQRAMEIRLLTDHRTDLVGESTRVQNRLRWHLVSLCPELEASLALRTLAGPRQLDRVDRRLRRMDPCARVRVAREQVSQLRRLARQTGALEQELAVLVKAYRPQLLAETGCGTLTAATLIGRTAGAKRFSSDAAFARQAGIAPVQCSSGKRTGHRLHRGGDRQLNRALHVIAITRARIDPATKAYLERKEAEGKTKKGALRCLKRHLARRFYHLLELPTDSPNPSPTATAAIPPPSKGTITMTAPATMPCLR
ncbi:MAG: IS110 family transposase [Actinobacteria bacterium]|nr:IS110 family transposase [Actinomycetota bacterium]